MRAGMQSVTLVTLSEHRDSLVQGSHPGCMWNHRGARAGNTVSKVPLDAK